MGPAEEAEPPKLGPGLEIYLEAYYLIDRRNHSQGPEYIKWSEVQFYALANDFDDRQTEWLHYFVREMDDFEVGRVAEEQEQARARNNKSG